MMCAVRPHIPYIVSTSTFSYFDGKNILPWVAMSSWEGVFNIPKNAKI